MVIARTLIDGVFIYFQWTIYPYKEYIPDVYKCNRAPCPYTVECWPSSFVIDKFLILSYKTSIFNHNYRVKEKTIFFHYMYITAAITALLNLAELIYIGVRRLRVAFCGAYGGVDPMFEDPSEVESVFSQQTGRSSKGEIFDQPIGKCWHFLLGTYLWKSEFKFIVFMFNPWIICSRAHQLLCCHSVSKFTKSRLWWKHHASKSNYSFSSIKSCPVKNSNGRPAVAHKLDTVTCSQNAAWKLLSLQRWVLRTQTHTALQGKDHKHVLNFNHSSQNPYLVTR